jgi:hypothetical protein
MGGNPLIELLEKHPGGGFMVPVHGNPEREIDWLIVLPRAKRGDSGEPGPDHAPPGPRHGEPPTAPSREEHAAGPAPAARPLEPPATQEPDGQTVAAQAAVGRPSTAEQGTGPQAGAPAGNDGFSAVSDGLDSGSAGLPPAMFGNDFTGQPSTTAAAGAPAPAMTAMAGAFDNLPEVPPTADVSADPPARTVVADAAEDGVDTGGDLFASDFPNDASVGFGDVTS